MDSNEHVELATEAIVQRARDRLARHRARTLKSVDQLFVKLFLAEWIVAILTAIIVSPYAWEGKVKTVHAHVWTAVLLGGVIISLPIALALRYPGAAMTRHVVAVAQMLFGAVLIHLTGGRIETHFDVFCSLAFLAFYLDWKVLLTASITVTIEHFIRGLLWPESIYGITNPEWWRFLEHALWVVICAAFLVASCLRQVREWLTFAEEGGMIEAMAETEWRQRSVLERAEQAVSSETK